MRLKSFNLFILSLFVALAIVGCGDSRENFVITQPGGGSNNQPNQPAEAPMALDDTFTALGNATLNQAAAGVLANDTLNSGTITSFDSTTTAGGTVDLNEDGSFTYTPAENFNGSDTFTYTLSNDEGDSTATVTLTVQNFGRFVDTSAPAGGDGTQASPFNTLAAGLSAAQDGDTIFVFGGDGNAVNQGEFTLPEGVNLIGEGSGLVLGQQIVAPGQRPIIDDTVVPEGNNVIAGFRFVVSNDNRAIDNFPGIENLTILDNELEAIDDSVMVELDGISGLLTIEQNLFEGVGGENLCINQTDVDCQVSIVGNSFLSEDSQTACAMDIGISGQDTAGSLTISENTIEGADITNSFDEGIEVTVGQSAIYTIAVTNNVIRNINREGIDIDNSDPSTVNLSITGNEVRQTGEQPIQLATTGEMTALISNNVVEAFDQGCSVAALGSGEFNVAVRGNDFTATMTTEMLQINAGLTATACADITDNTFGGDLDLIQAGSGVVNIERLDADDDGPLNAVNNFTSGGVLETGTITSVAAGFCNIP